MKRIVAFGIVGVLALVGVACDDDGGGGGNDQAFCDLNTELSESDEEASDEQLDELADVAPEEIRDDARAILDHIKEEGQGSDLPGDLDDESENVQQWIGENCDGEDSPTDTSE